MPTIRRLRDRWQAMVRRKAIAPQCKSFDKRADAVQWARHLEAEADRVGLSAGAPFLQRMTLGELLTRYRDQVSPNKRSAHSERARIAAMILKPIAQRQLWKLTSADIANYRDERLLEVSPGTVVRELSILSHAIDVSTREWGIPLLRNPVNLVRRPRVPQGRNQRLNVSEEQRLISACEPGQLRQLVLLAIETGMRRGELLALQWEDVDLDRRIAHIRLTKNGDPRTIPLSMTASAALKDLAANKQSSSSDVFSLSVNSLRHQFDKARRAAGLNEFRFHDLRHEAVSRFFERGFNVIEAAAISGHRDVRMLRRYAHLHAVDIVARLDATERGRPSERCV